MATLHVRGVPDDLYEALRTRAERNGRSIAAEALSILEPALLAPELRLTTAGFLRRRRTAGPTTPFGRFSARARRVVTRAQAAAKELGHDHLGTEHLLVALATDEAGAGRLLTRDLKLGRDELLSAIEEKVGRGDASPGGEMPLTPRTKKALELALREAIAVRHAQIEPEHVLVGIAACEDSVGAQILRERGVEPSELRGLATLALAAGGSSFEMSSAAEADPPPLRVVELEGTADDWEAALNAAAADGYELVEIVGSRAVFRSSASRSDLT